MHKGDWYLLDPAGLGEQATMYSFRHRQLDRDSAGDGALVVFSRGDFVTVLAMVNWDGRASVDLRRYAQLVDSRLRRELVETTR